ncbi:MAG: DNA translocase FtsK 4TM domain-containing protein [Aestuariivita sp.]|nr:DNA translocase FtsK 4TM domain-containing protein [Aestuariivita sp.]
MAFLNQRSRTSFLDNHSSEVFKRRGKELFGLCLIVFGIVIAFVFCSYFLNDQRWMVSGDASIQKEIVRISILISAALFMIIGLGAWLIVVGCLVWGMRLVLHIGEDRAIGRLIFSPFSIALVSVCSANLGPSNDWINQHSFGFGGLFGDTVLGLALTLLPFTNSFGLNLFYLILVVLMLLVSAFTLGFTPKELSRILNFLISGTVIGYAGLLTFMGRVITPMIYRIQHIQDRRVSSQELNQSFAKTMHTHEGSVETATGSHVDRRRYGTVRTDPVLSSEIPVKKVEIIDPLGRDDGPVQDEDFIKNQEVKEDVLHPVDYRVRSKILAIIKSKQNCDEALDESHDVSSHTALRTNEEPLLSRTEQSDDLMTDTADSVNLNFSRLTEPPVSSQKQLFDTPEMATPKVETHGVVMNVKKKATKTSKRARAEAQPSLNFDGTKDAFELPPLALLDNPVDIQGTRLSNEALEENARLLENVLDDYGVKGEIVSVRPGPVVTMYELEPAPGLKASRVIGLADDIARSMSALSARVSTVPGRSVIGIELPNDHREKVVLRKILSSQVFGDSNMSLPLALGKDIGGDPVVANLVRMPHLLIAGTTGSGKSVAVNTMILSLLYKHTPEECRLIMIDPKMLELSVYDGIPHLLSPVVTDPKKAVVALKWVVGEMEARYQKMSKIGVRNIDGFNARVQDALSKGEMFTRTVQTGFDEETGEPTYETEESEPKTLPFIVVIVDEMADLMMVAGKEIEACIQRLAQMARASGIHLIMATQRPSVDVITGTIKANFPTRISFQVTSKIDSRTILGEMGAEQLLGMGDMLYLAGGAKIMRCHGPFVSDKEVEDVVQHLKSYGSPEYVGEVVEGPSDESDIDLVLGLGGNTEAGDALYDQAVQIVIADRKCSTSYIQRKLSIGYNKAARLVEQMEESGLVSSANHVGKREILIPEQ